MGKKTNRIQKKNRRRKQNKTSGINKRISSIEAHKSIVLIQQLFARIEEVIQTEINNPKSEDSAFNTLTCVAYLDRIIELKNKLKRNGYHQIINPEIETKITSCLELFKRIPDDELIEEEDDEELMGYNYEPIENDEELMGYNYEPIEDDYAYP